MAEDVVISTLKMDRAEPLGNSDDGTGRRALHVKNLNQLVPEAYDSIIATYPTTSSEVYTYKLLAVTIATVTVTYTDSTKQTLTSVVRS